MGMFSKKRPVQLPQDARVEILVDQNATKEAFNAAKQANDNLKRLLVENGFTIKLYLAAGGKHGRKGNT